VYPRHVFIAASGIVVRAVAPHLTAKDQDPAVVVLDQEGDYVISLVSGPLGGANDLAREVALLHQEKGPSLTDIIGGIGYIIGIMGLLMYFKARRRE